MQCSLIILKTASLFTFDAAFSGVRFRFENLEIILDLFTKEIKQLYFLQLT